MYTWRLMLYTRLLVQFINTSHCPRSLCFMLIRMNPSLSSLRGTATSFNDDEALYNRTVPVEVENLDGIRMTMTSSSTVTETLSPSARPFCSSADRWLRSRDSS